MRLLRRLLLLLLVAATAAHARTSATLNSAKLDADSLSPGQSATAVVTIQVADGLHAQSHTPLGDTYIPLTLSLAAPAGVSVGQPQYPPGQIVNYSQLGKLSVYVGTVEIRVPVTANDAIGNGPLSLSGKVRLQACTDRACFPPETITFTIETTVRGGSTAAPASVPSTTPGDAPVSATSVKSNEPTLFGLRLTQSGLPLIVAAAFCVGIVFNAMPCVLPVMPLKIMGFYEVSQHDRRKCLALGAVFSAGLIFFFLVLATLILALRWIDWGGLFRLTWFTLLIVGLLLVVALGTFGVFNVLLPGRVYNLRPREDSYTGNFLFGMLTAMLSTPCTFGAFVALLAWTVTQPILVGYAIFASVGVGMATPYFILSALPGVARKFPRSGPWPEVIKQLTAFLILATAVFFAQPLISRYVSTTAVWWTIFGVILAAGVFLVVRAMQLSPHLRPRLIAAAVAMALVLPSFALVRRFTSRPYTWQPFSQLALDEARAAGRPVVIDFTADWCGNCHWLEATVLHHPRIVAAVRDRNALMLQADVTHENAPGQTLLHELNPTGSIPFTAVYTQRGQSPATLDGIYGTEDLLKLLN